MGVPKFFRWISERYPKINQPIHAPPNPETQKQYFPNAILPKNQNDENKRNKFQQDDKTFIQKNSIIPEFDRLYLDMNGIIHCCSHNNAGDDNATTDPDTHIENNDPTSPSSTLPPSASSPENGTVTISEDEIFRNVCYYVDRVVTDIVKPKELVYMAIDGVAPRAKMNQQRSRRYRSGKEREIEKTFYAAHLLKQKKEREMQMQQQQSMDVEGDYGQDDSLDFNFVNMDGEYEYNRENVNRSMMRDQHDIHSDMVDSMDAGDIKEVEPGRFTGKFETSGMSSTDKDSKIRSSSLSLSSVGSSGSGSGSIGINADNGMDSSSLFNQDYDDFLKSIKELEGSNNEDESTTSIPTSFHSNAITPGTPFFERCTAHLNHFIKRKLHSDPRWAHLTVIFSGPRTPGEGEVCSSFLFMLYFLYLYTY